MDAVRLSPHDEEEWERLRAQFHFAEGYWLGFLFSASSYEARIIRQRVAQVVEERGGALEVFTPDSPGALRGVLPWLLSPERKEAACVWVEGFFVDLTGKDAAPWVDAWDEVILRANERREALRRHLKGGLVFAAPVGIKPRVREAAPDLWSSRAIVVEMLGGVYPQHPMIDMAPPMPEPAVEGNEEEAAPDPEFWMAEAERRLPGTADRASALVQAARGLAGEGRQLDEALVRFSEAAEIYRGLSQSRPEVFLSELADCNFNAGFVQLILGRRDMALNSMREATEIYRSLAQAHPEAFSLRLANSQFLGGVLEVEQRLKAGEVPEALALVSDLRNLAGLAGPAYPGAAAQRAIAWFDLGRALNRAGLGEEALGALTEARQRIAAIAAAGSAEAARLETRVIAEQGLALANRGELEEAAAAYEEAIRRGQVHGEGGKVASMRSQLAMVRFLQRRFEDALELLRGALAQFESLGDSLRQAIAWQMIGVNYAGQWRSEDAERALQRSLELARSVGDEALEARSQELLAELSRLRSASPPT